MSKHDEDVTVALTGISMSASTGKVGVNAGVKLVGEQVTTEQVTFNYTKEVHSKKEKPWLTWLNITVTIIMAMLGALSLGDPVYGSVAGAIIGFILIVGGKYVKNKKIDITVSSR